MLVLWSIQTINNNCTKEFMPNALCIRNFCFILVRVTFNNKVQSHDSQESFYGFVGYRTECNVLEVKTGHSTQFYAAQILLYVKNI